VALRGGGTVKKWTIRVGAGVAVVAGLGLGYFELVKEGFIRFNRWDRRERGSLLRGAQAPDLDLALYEGGSVKLSSLWGQKPVFLVFGSCT
jgi:hypothetical protein